MQSPRLFDFDVEDVSTNEFFIQDILSTDVLYSWDFNCNDNIDDESCSNYEYCKWENQTCSWSDEIGSDHNIISP